MRIFTAGLQANAFQWVLRPGDPVRKSGFTNLFDGNRCNVFPTNIPPATESASPSMQSL